MTRNKSRLRSDDPLAIGVLADESPTGWLVEVSQAPAVVTIAAARRGRRPGRRTAGGAGRRGLPHALEPLRRARRRGPRARPLEVSADHVGVTSRSRSGVDTGSAERRSAKPRRTPHHDWQQHRHQRAALPPATAQRPPCQPDPALPDPARLPGEPGAADRVRRDDRARHRPRGLAPRDGPPGPAPLRRRHVPRQHQPAQARQILAEAPAAAGRRKARQRAVDETRRDVPAASSRSPRGTCPGCGTPTTSSRATSARASQPVPPGPTSPTRGAAPTAGCARRSTSCPSSRRSVSGLTPVCLTAGGEEWWGGSCQQSTKESTLLTLTENASTIVKNITAAQGGPDTAGLRISTEDPSQGLTVNATRAPAGRPDRGRRRCRRLPRRPGVAGARRPDPRCRGRRGGQRPVRPRAPGLIDGA